MVRFVKEAIIEVSKSVPQLTSKDWRFALVAAAYMHDINQDNITQHVTEKLNGRKHKTIHIFRITELIMSTKLDTYSIPYEPQISVMDIAKTIIRCGDLCHYTFELPRHLRRVNNEINNAEFIRMYVVPQFELLTKICGTARSKEWLSNVMFKLQYWSDRHTTVLQKSIHNE